MWIMEGYYGIVFFVKIPHLIFASGPGSQFHQCYMSSICARRSRKRKKTDNLTVFLCFRNLHAEKLHVER